MWFIRVVTLGSSALLSIVTARALGPHGRGTFALPAIEVSVAVTFSVGLSAATSYFLLNGRAGRQILHSLPIAFVIFAICGAVMTTIMAFVCHGTWAIAPAITYMVFYATYSVICGYYFGRDRAQTAGYVNAFLSLVTLGFVSIAVSGAHPSAYVGVSAWVMAIGVVSIVGLCCVWQDANNLTGEPVNASALVSFAAKAGSLNLANLLNYRIDIFVVAALLPISTVGLYTVAVTGAESALSLTLAVSQAALPSIGSLAKSEAAVFTARCLRNTLFFAMILSSVGILAAPLLISVLFGRAYLPIVQPVRILLVGVVAASTSSLIANYFVLNRGRAAAPLTTSLSSAGLCGVLSIVLIPRIGILGAAIASTLAYAISQAAAVVYFCRVSGIGALETLCINRGDFDALGRVGRRILGVLC